MKNNVTFLFLLTLSILVLVTSLTVAVYAQEEENTINSKDPIKFFAIQNANSGSILEVNNTFTLSLTNETNNIGLTSDTSKIYSLELNNVSDKTILFSNRPDRIVTSISTSDFIRNWSSGDNNFAENAPNAELVVDELKGQQESKIVELFDPVYELDKKTLKYEVTADNATYIDLQNEFGQSTLVIDSHCSPLDPRC